MNGCRKFSYKARQELEEKTGSKVVTFINYLPPEKEQLTGKKDSKSPNSDKEQKDKE